MSVISAYGSANFFEGESSEFEESKRHNSNVNIAKGIIKSSITARHANDANRPIVESL